MISYRRTQTPPLTSSNLSSWISTRLSCPSFGTPTLAKLSISLKSTNLGIFLIRQFSSDPHISKSVSTLISKVVDGLTWKPILPPFATDLHQNILVHCSAYMAPNRYSLSLRLCHPILKPRLGFDGSVHLVR